MKKSLIILMVLVLVFTMNSFAEKVKSTTPGFQSIGRLSSLSPMGNPTQVGIELFDENTGVGISEEFFTMDESTIVENKRNIIDIRMGDTVLVTYSEIKEVSEDGSEKIEKKATSIKFLKSTGTTTDMQKIREEFAIQVGIEKILKEQQKKEK